MANDYYDDDESDPSEAESSNNETSVEDTPEEKLAIVTPAFFKEDMDVGDREMVEVVRKLDGEIVIKCVYGDKDKDEEEEPEVSESSAEQDMMAAEPEMMG